MLFKDCGRMDGHTDDDDDDGRSVSDHKSSPWAFSSGELKSVWKTIPLTLAWKYQLELCEALLRSAITHIFLEKKDNTILFLFCLLKNLLVWFGLNVPFNNLSVISRRCLDVTGSSMLTFRVLPHWNTTPQTLWHDIPPSHIILTLNWPVLVLLS